MDPLIKASERHAFTDKDAEIEHLRKELTIMTFKARVVDDIKKQNEMLQEQLDVAYRTNKEQINVNLTQADQINELAE